MTGSMAGSVIGGRWSDRVLRKMKEANGGKWYAEVRFWITTYWSSSLTSYEDATGEYETGDAVATTVCRWLCLGMREAC
jgi:hypothetical protein